MGVLGVFLLSTEVVQQCTTDAAMRVPPRCPQVRHSSCRGINLFPVPLVDSLSVTLPAITGNVMAILAVTPQSKWISVCMHSNNHLTPPHSPLFEIIIRKHLTSEEGSSEMRAGETLRRSLLHQFVRVTLPKRRQLKYTGTWEEWLPKTLHFYRKVIALLVSVLQLST